MALWNYAEVKQEVMDNIVQLQSSDDPESLLGEFSESACPIYNHEIISEWASLPSEHEDAWQQYGMDEFFWQGGIIRLMSVDLAEYYRHEFLRAWSEILESSHATS